MSRIEERLKEASKRRAVMCVLVVIYLFEFTFSLYYPEWINATVLDFLSNTCHLQVNPMRDFAFDLMWFCFIKFGVVITLLMGSYLSDMAYPPELIEGWNKE